MLENDRHNVMTGHREIKEERKSGNITGEIRIVAFDDKKFCNKRKTI